MLPNFQFALKKTLRAVGFRFERHPDSEITVWRRTLRRSPNPKCLVIVPGFGDTPVSWLPFLLLLMIHPEFRRQQFDEIAILEFPGYLGAPRSARCLANVEAFLQSLVKILDYLKPHTLIGQSMGGGSVAYYSSLVSARTELRSLKQIVLICPSGLVPEGMADMEWSRAFEIILQGDVDSYVRKALGPNLDHPLLGVPMNWLGREFKMMLARDDIRGFISSFKPEHFTTANNTCIRIPTLLVWGEKDVLIPFGVFPSWVELLKIGTPEGMLSAHSIADAGHGVHIEKPRDLVNLVCEQTRAWKT